MDNEQTDLFKATETINKFQRQSVTSLSAAQQIENGAKTLRAKVYGFIKISSRYGATDQELQVALDMDPSTQRPRRVELVEKGLVRDSGKKRKTKSGRDAVVWVRV